MRVQMFDCVQMKRDRVKMAGNGGTLSAPSSRLLSILSWFFLRSSLCVRQTEKTKSCNGSKRTKNINRIVKRGRYVGTARVLSGVFHPFGVRARREKTKTRVPFFIFFYFSIFFRTTTHSTKSNKAIN